MRRACVRACVRACAMLLTALVTARTNMLQPHQHQLPFVPPKAMRDAPIHEQLERVLSALDDEERWKQGDVVILRL